MPQQTHTLGFRNAISINSINSINQSEISILHTISLATSILKTEDLLQIKSSFKIMQQLKYYKLHSCYQHSNYIIISNFAQYRVGHTHPFNLPELVEDVFSEIFVIHNFQTFLDMLLRKSIQSILLMRSFTPRTALELV